MAGNSRNARIAEIKARLAFWKSVLKKTRAAYIALVDGGVKSYSFPDRTLTKLDVPDLLKQILEAEERVDELTAQLIGQKPRKAFGIVPRDW